MQHPVGRGRIAATLSLVALAALVATAPAPAATASAASGHVHGACNPFIANGIGSLEPARAAAVGARGGTLGREPAMNTTNTEIAGPAPKVRKGFTVTVPVYFHVINKGPALSDGNVPDKQILAQMKALNDTFSGRRGGADSGFRFQLVAVDRTTNQTWFDMATSNAEREAKRALHQGGRNALNVYSNSGAGFLGYAYFPKDIQGKEFIDGIVLNYESLPGGTATNFDLGFTLTHEAGHWLGLFHTFQNGCAETGDRIEDTPPQQSPTSGCPIGRDSCPDPGLDPIHNYMDYSYDACYTEFTPDQAQRMAEQWLAFRAP